MWRLKKIVHILHTFSPTLSCLIDKNIALLNEYKQIQF